MLHRRPSFALAACLALVPLFAVAADDPQTEAERKVAGAVFTAYNKMLESRFAVDVQSTDDKGNQAKALAEYEGVSRFHVKTDRLEIVATPEGKLFYAQVQASAAVAAAWIWPQNACHAAMLSR